ncbi:GH19866 [Drosophila grimshawi]|uniref:GH19866 n=1 Tax=Drosophila grimshawi TaxID=7222 RepID=B4J9A1_DROGR|nr:GH19866 [Drosophila grimshawi]
MATSAIRCSVVSSSAGRRNLCDSSQEELNVVTPALKSKSKSKSRSSTHIIKHQRLDDKWPVEHTHQPLSTVSLGTLSAKVSPIFARRLVQVEQQLSSSHFSLRSANPAYVKRQPQIDLSAVEALSTLEVRMPAERPGMDINRNNGYLYNGTTTSSSSSSRRTTKLIVAKLAKEPSKKPKQKQPKTQAEPEKIVITESKRDTPPRERAPAKPSRANANQLASSSGAVRKSSNTSTTNTTATSSSNVPSRKERDLLQQQQQRGHRVKHRSLSNSSNTGTTAAPASPVPALETPPVHPPPPPPPQPAAAAGKTSTIVVVSLSDVEEQTDAVSLAESAGAQPVVRFEVGSAVRGPAADVDTYEAALLAAATQQPSSSEELSDSSLRRHTFAQQPKVAVSDHDSIEGRRETLHYQSVRAGDSIEVDADSEKDVGEAKPMPAFGDLTMEQEMEPTIMAPSSEKREHLYKILVIGELGTGKTSFIKRYVHQFFSQNYRATIGVDFALKVLHWDTNTIVRLQLWDIAGQERFGNMTRVYYKEAVGAFIVFDVTRSGTFDCVSKWKEDLDSKVQLPDGSPIPCILLANKCDQEKQGIVTQPERMDEYVRENGFAGWFETSAKENINIDEAARALVNKILINDKLITADANDAEKFNLSSAADASADSKSKCSC